MMHDNFDEMYKGAKTPEAIAAIDGLWKQAKKDGRDCVRPTITMEGFWVWKARRGGKDE